MDPQLTDWDWVLQTTLMKGTTGRGIGNFSALILDLTLAWIQRIYQGFAIYDYRDICSCGAANMGQTDLVTTGIGESRPTCLPARCLSITKSDVEIAEIQKLLDRRLYSHVKAAGPAQLSCLLEY